MKISLSKFWNFENLCFGYNPFVHSVLTGGNFVINMTSIIPPRALKADDRVSPRVPPLQRLGKDYRVLCVHASLHIFCLFLMFYMLFKHFFDTLSMILLSGFSIFWFELIFMDLMVISRSVLFWFDGISMFRGVTVVWKHHCFKNIKQYHLYIKALQLINHSYFYSLVLCIIIEVRIFDCLSTTQIHVWQNKVFLINLHAYHFSNLG